MSKAAERAMMSPVVSEWRAFFAPVDRATTMPVIFDPAQAAGFDVDSPTTPWIDAGPVANFKRTPLTKVQQTRGGQLGGVSSQCRADVDARVEFDFCQWGKLQMALAGGGEHFNVLATSSIGVPSGGTAVSAIPVQSGSTATEIVVGAANVAAFNSGDIVSIDVDYAGQTGYVGSGAAAAYVRSAAGLGVDYVRRMTFNVERIDSLATDRIVLAKPLIGGAPTAGAKVQRVLGFADREGARFFHEWSAVFISASQSGGRVCFYYPRLQACAPASESKAEIVDSMQALMLHASFIALPYTDSNDGQQSVCWRSYTPAANAAVY